MADNKNKRTAPTIQDVLNGQAAKPRARFKSGYTGPRKAPAPAASGATAPMPSASRPAGTYRSGGILDYAWIVYSVILSIALTTAVIAYVHGVGKSR